MNKKILVLFTTIAFGCATVAVYRPIVDPASITDQSKYTTDSSECEWITNEVDYSDEKAMAALKGGAVGGAAVVAGTTVVLATTGGLSAIAAGTAVVAPIVWPLLGAGMLIGAGANKNKTKRVEQELRALVWNRCLTERGYVVLSDANSTKGNAISTDVKVESPQTKEITPSSETQSQFGNSDEGLLIDEKIKD